MSLAGFVISQLSANNPPIPSSGGPFRPPQYGKPQKTSLTCTLPSTTAQTNNASSDTPSSPTTYFLDAVFRVEHTQELVCTEHPVQVGPAIVDHAYLRPAMVMLEIGMSDAMESYVAGQYSGASSKSVFAYQTFKQIQAARVTITLATHLDNYQNMVITDIRAVDDPRTPFALRCSIYMRQIISATVSVTTQSQRPDQTGATNEGTKSTTTLDPTTQNLLNSMGSFPTTTP